MFHSVRMTRVVALLALLAWSNVQAMACCWTMQEHASSDPVEVASPKAEDHSCCPGGEVQSVPASQGSDESATAEPVDETCGMPGTDDASLCCASGAPAEVTAFSPQFSLVQIAFVVSLLPVFPEKQPEPVLPNPAHASGGSPRYLALERILI